MQIWSAYDTERAYGEAFPAQSLLRLQLPVDSPAKVRAFQTFTLPELLMTGYRQSLAPARCVRDLYRQGTDVLFETARGYVHPSEAATRIDNYIDPAESLLEAWQPVATSIDRFFVTTMVREAGYLEQMADVFGAMHPDADPAGIRTDLTDLADSLSPTVPNQYVFDRLNDLYQTYNRPVAEAVADIALDVPYRFGPGAEPVASFAPIDRLKTVASALEQVDDVTSQSADELREQLRQYIDGEVTSNVPDVELLSVPLNKTDPIRFPTPDIEEVPVSGAAMDQTIARVFRQGGFGGVVYEQEAGRNRLINPHVATEAVTGTTYETYWQRAYFGAELLDMFRDRTDPDQAIECPLCRVSVERCGGNTCGCRSLLNPIADVATTLIRETNR